MKNESNGYTYFIGRNARENWQLLDSAEPFDIWFHLDKQSSPYVILQVRDTKEVPYGALVEGARLCKEYSKAKNDKSVPVIYCTVENLKKGKMLGEVITKNTKRLNI
jgi:predicted ribosome quality control (RQC) complex YloA/Tae2 family protein